MRRWFILLLAIFLVTGGFVLGIFWLLGTTGGARWMMGAISRWTPVKIDAEKLTGQLGKELRMEGVRIRWPQGEMKMEDFKIRWHPLYLLMGKATIEDLALQGVQIQDNRPEIKTTGELGWPTVPSLSLWVHGEVKNLQVKELSYRRQSHGPLKVERFAARLDWSYGLLTLGKMDLVFPSGVVKGTVELGLMRPVLYLNLNLSPSKAMYGIDSLSLNSRLLPIRDHEEVAGHVMIEGRSGSVKRFLMETEIGLSRNALHLRNLVLSRPNRQGHFTGNGRITFTAGDVMTSLEMKLSDLDLSEEMGIETAFSGTLHVEGSPNDYRGKIRIENKKGGWDSGSLLGKFKGTLKGVNINLLDGSILHGNVQGHLNARWEEGLSLRGAFQARNLNPAAITPDWDGKINLDLEGAFRWPKEKSPEGRLSACLLKSHLRGQQLTGDIELHMEKSTLRIARGDLKGKGFDLFARGVLQERVIFHADISDLSGLIPGTRGSFLAKGWVRWRDQHLAMDFSGKGKDLFIKGIELGAADLSARFDEREEAPGELKGRFLKVAYKSFRIDSVTLDASGKLSRHKMIVAARSPDGQIKSTFEATYSREGWRGEITQLSGSDATGDWKLRAPAEIGVSSGQIKVKSLQVTSNRGETLQFSTDLTLHPLRGTLYGEWHQLNLARANPWLGRPRLTGHTTGELSIQWLEEDHLRLGGKVNLAGTFNDIPLKVDLSRGLLKFDWSEKGLSASWEFEDAKSGKLWGNLSSPQPGRMVLPDRGRLDANWEGIDLSQFQPFLPRTLAIEGRLRGKLSGQWTDRMKRFGAAGELKVSQGMIGWKHGADRITTILQSAEVRWDWNDDVLRGSLSLALEEVGYLKGRFGLPLETHWPISVRDKGPIRLSLEGQFQEKGLVSTFFPELIRESRGKVDLDLNADGTWGRPHLKGSLRLTKAEIHLLASKIRLQTAKNNISEAPLKLELPEGLIKFNWDEKGLSSSCHLEFATGGKFQISLSSFQRARMAFPDRGNVEASWEAFDVGVLGPWLPPKMALEGQLSGHLSGQYSNRQFDTAGEINISQGVLNWKHETGSVQASLRRAGLTWNWQADHLRGEVSLILADYGHVQGNFQLPLTARFPVTIRPGGPIQLSLNGQFEEKGLLPAFFPGIVQESRGQIHLNLTGNGTWEKPNLLGTMKMEKAGGYLPMAGIRLEDLSTEVQFRGDQIRIASFRTRSGPGYLDGVATIWLENRKVSRYEGRLRGDRFQTIHLPELQALSNPHLDFHGTTQKLFVRGEIRLPDLMISGPPTKDVIRPSPDVIIVDVPEVAKPGFPLAVDIEVRLLLGEKVYYKAEGIDVRLRGDLRLNVQDPYRIAATGVIGVAQGHYSFYGKKLDIVRGRLLFAGGPVDSPTVDALAVRKIGEVQAGVTVAGSLQKPVIKLYSRPSMPDTDILSYIVLGQPLGKGTEAVPSLIQASGALLSAGESVVLQGQLKKMFGLDTLDITTPPGGGEVSRSMVTVGKYLTPKLYISLGRSLFTDATLVTLRYSLSKPLEIETTTGTESGATLFYRIEFR